MNSGIYCIKNQINGKMYIGSAVNIPRREQVHLSRLGKNKHHSHKLQNAWNKYGGDNFCFMVLEMVPNKNDLIKREQMWLDCLKVVEYGYNICAIADNCLGVKHTEETRRKVSEAGMGRICSPETRAKLSKIHTGRIISKEQRLKLSEANRNPSAEIREKNAAAHRGKVASKETRRKMSEARKGVPKTKEHARKIGDAHIGMKRSLEARARISAGMVGRITSKETRLKQSVAHSNISPETRVKMSTSKKGKQVGPDNPFYGKKHSPESSAKMALAWETRRKRMAANG